jgi:undecaprenyl-diphosphatase
VSPAALARRRSLLLLALACFALLAAGAATLGALPADVIVREALLAAATPAVVAVMRVVNGAGDWRLLVPGALVVFAVFRQARARWWAWSSAMLAAPILETAFKQLVGRPRPEGTAMGFPSGHATAAAAFFGVVMLLAGTLPPRACAAVRALAVAMIVLVGLARVILRAHWPSDVVAGIALGLALAAAAGLLAARTRSTTTTTTP